VIEQLLLFAQKGKDVTPVAAWGTLPLIALAVLAVVSFAAVVASLVHAIRNPALSTGMRIGWILVILFLGPVGALLYVLMGDGQSFLHYAWQFRNELGLVGAICVVVLVTTILSESYQQKPARNAAEVVRQASMLGIIALGAAVVIISGGIDLSSGSMIAFGGSICCMTILALDVWTGTTLAVDPDADPTTHITWWILTAAIGVTVLTGFLVGSLHAWLITVIRLPPFVATLASLVGLRSLAQILNGPVKEHLVGVGGAQINVYDQDLFAPIGTAWYIPLAVFLVLAALVWFMMNMTIPGRHLYAMGGNETAARLSGVRTDALKWLAYSIGGVTSAIAGVLYSAEVGVADPETAGMGYELYAIAASVVGGCSLAGGVGLIPGVVLGALFLRVVMDAVAKIIRSGSDDFEGLIVGFLVVIAVAFNELRTRTASTARNPFPGVLGAIVMVVLGTLIYVVTLVLTKSPSAACAIAMIAWVIFCFFQPLYEGMKGAVLMVILTLVMVTIAVGLSAFQMHPAARILCGLLAGAIVVAAIYATRFVVYIAKLLIAKIVKWWAGPKHAVGGTDA